MFVEDHAQFARAAIRQSTDGAASADLYPFPLAITSTARAAAKGPRGAVVWMTGLSGAGKSTIASELDHRLHLSGHHSYVLDGDAIRKNLSRDLGFDRAARIENNRRIAEVARLMADAGLIVIVALISPFVADRMFARSRFASGEFFEIHVDVPLALAEQRDPKGLYRRARAGEITNFTGLDSPYERPDRPDLRLDTAVLDPEQAADAIVALLRSERVVIG